MPCLALQNHKQVENILSALEAEAEEDMKKPGQELHENVSKGRDKSSNGDILDVAVSFDGAWAKRCFTSLTGILFVTSVDTGKVLDYHVLSKVCQKCSLKKSVCKDDAEFEEWSTKHLAAGE